MPINITMPALSPTMEEGTLARWVVAEGDTVEPGDIIAEIETDKATMEVEAVDEGIVGRLLVAEGTEGVKVNAVIAVLLEDGESKADLGDVSPEAASASANDQPRANGDASAPAASPMRAAPIATPTKQDVTPQQMNGGRIFASPLARRIAQIEGIVLSRIKGSGPHGRIIKADVEAAAKAPPATISTVSAPAPLTTGPSADQVAALYADRTYRKIALDGMRRTIAARLTEAKQSIPHFYLRREIALDTLLATRARINDRLAERGIKVSVNDFVIKACATALQQVPEANAAWAGDCLLSFDASDVAVAVAIEGGLFTPVIRDAETKGLAQISSEMKDLAERARARKLAPHEYQGGSFAISNLGMFGIENFDAVINPPQASILAVGAGMQKPVVRDGAIEVATMMSVTLSVDHRVIDGALGARYLDAIKAGLEDPAVMLL